MPGDQAEDPPGLGVAQVEVGHQEAREELAERVHRGGRQAPADQDPPDRRLGEQELEDRAGAGRRTRQHLAVRQAPGRLAQGEEGDHGHRDRRNAQGEEPLAPAQRLGEPAAEHGAGHGPDGRAQPDHGHGRGALVPRIMVSDQRGHGRAEAGVADAHAHAEQEELPEIARDPAARDHDAEDGDGNRDDLGAAHPLGHAGQRQAEQGVEDGEAQPLDQAELGVRQLQVDLDRRRRGRHPLPVGQVQGVDRQQHEQHPRPVARGEGHQALSGGSVGPAALERALGRGHGFPPGDRPPSPLTQSIRVPKQAVKREERASVPGVAAGRSRWEDFPSPADRVRRRRARALRSRRRAGRATPRMRPAP